MNPINATNTINATNEIDDEIKHRFDKIDKVLIELMNLMSRIIKNARLENLKGMLLVKVCKANAK